VTKKLGTEGKETRAMKKMVASEMITFASQNNTLERTGWIIIFGIFNM